MKFIPAKIIVNNKTYVHRKIEKEIKPSLKRREILAVAVAFLFRRALFRGKFMVK